jgi:site-specific DNA-methyltransferase (adenine-specific)
MTKITLHAGDNRIHLRRLIDQGIRVQSAVFDPPYGLVSVQKRFGKEGAAPARTEGNDGSFARLSGGFMGKAWDATGIERDPEFWRLVYEILEPGGYVFAFSGSRTGHWQAVAMELAGFVMHPMHGWVFGSGFPKAHNADKAIDKMLGQKGEIVAQGSPVKRMIPGADQHRDGSWIKDNGREYQPGTYVPASVEAGGWSGWAYGTQAQKPALEPIYLGQKPFSEKTGAANLLKHGVGAVNIDGCRVPVADDSYRQNCSGNRGHADNRTRVSDFHMTAGSANELGRWPANLLHDGSDEVVALFPREGGAKAPVKGTEPTANGFSGATSFGGMINRIAGQFHGDTGSAARFFNSFPRFVCEICCDQGWITGWCGSIPTGPEICPMCEGRTGIPADMPPIIYNGKAGKTDRAGSAHPTVKPIALLQHLIRHITPPGGVVLDAFAGSGTTAEAARREGFDCILMEAEPEYIAFLQKRFGLGDTELAYLLSDGMSDTLDDLLT